MCPSPAPNGGTPQVLGGIGTITRAAPAPAVVTHYNIAPAIDIYATPANGRDLGAVAGDIQNVLKSL